MITLICSLAQDNAIGFQNRLLYPIRADLQRFKALTTGHTIIMGRRTFESLPKATLPHRRNLVLSHTHIHALPEHADAFFPEIDPKLWDVVSSEYHPADGDTPAYTFTDYLRK